MEFRPFFQKKLSRPILGAYECKFHSLELDMCFTCLQLSWPTLCWLAGVGRLFCLRRQGQTWRRPWKDRRSKKRTWQSMTGQQPENCNEIMWKIDTKNLVFTRLFNLFRLYSPCFLGWLFSVGFWWLPLLRPSCLKEQPHQLRPLKSGKKQKITTKFEVAFESFKTVD